MVPKLFNLKVINDITFFHYDERDKKAQEALVKGNRQLSVGFDHLLPIMAPTNPNAYFTHFAFQKSRIIFYLKLNKHTI